MTHRHGYPIAVMVVVALTVHGADLVTGPQVAAYLQSQESAQVASSADLTAPGILEADPATDRPVSYKVTQTPCDAQRLSHIAALVGMEENDAVVTRGDRTMKQAADGRARVGYDARSGAYFYYNNTAEHVNLADTSPQAIDALKTKAEALLAGLLGDRAADFRFANNETDWYNTADDLTARISKMTFRYTRMVNGRHVVDNTAFFRAAYAGNQELFTFELVNPDLQPAALELLVLPGATHERLTAFAEGKTVAGAPGGKSVTVNTITAEKAVESYLAVVEGATTWLVPHVSFWSTCALDNGDSFDRYVHLCIDAKRTPNLEPEMIEPVNRQ